MKIHCALVKGRTRSADGIFVSFSKAKLRPPPLNLQRQTILYNNMRVYMHAIQRKAGKVIYFFDCHLSFTIGKAATNTIAP